MGYEMTDPQRWEEMLYCIAVVLLQIVLEAFILGTLFHYIVKKDQAVENFRKRLVMLEEYGSTRQLPSELRGRLRKHFEFQYQKTQEVDTGVLSLMPSSLKMKVASFQYEDVMERNMGLFKGCNAQFLNMVVVALRQGGPHQHVSVHVSMYTRHYPRVQFYTCKCPRVTHSCIRISTYETAA